MTLWLHFDMSLHGTQCSIVPVKCMQSHEHTAVCVPYAASLLRIYAQLCAEEFSRDSAAP